MIHTLHDGQHCEGLVKPWLGKDGAGRQEKKVSQVPYSMNIGYKVFLACN